MATQPVPVVDKTPQSHGPVLGFPSSHQPRPGTYYFQTEDGGFHGPRGPQRSEREASSVRRVMQRIGVISLCYFVMVSTWWTIHPGVADGISFGVVAIGIALALTNLVSLFIFTSLHDGRRDSHSYMAELVNMQSEVHTAPVPRTSNSR